MQQFRSFVLLVVTSVAILTICEVQISALPAYPVTRASFIVLAVNIIGLNIRITTITIANVIIIINSHAAVIIELSIIITIIVLLISH